MLLRLAANSDAYVAGLDGWQRAQVEALRAAVLELVRTAVALNAELGNPTAKLEK